MAGIISHWLIDAVRKGTVTLVTSLIDAYGLGYSPEWWDGYVLLLEALRYKRTEVAELLLRRGAKVNNNSKRIDTPLHLAAQNGDIFIVMTLLSRDANIFAKNQCGKTALFSAVEYNKIEIVTLLLKHKADVNTKDNNSTSLLHVAVKRKYLKIVEILLYNGADVNCTLSAACLNKNYTPLHYAIEYYMKDITVLLLSRGANVNVKDEYGMTPLHIAVEKGNEESVQLLLNSGADTSAIAKGYLTPLHIAINREDITIVKLLLQYGAKVDYQDKDDKTILHCAVEKGCLMIVEDILKYCPNINNESNRSSLKVAVYDYEKEKIVHALLDYGFNVGFEDINNSKLLHVAVRKGYLKIVEYLLTNGADVNTLHNSLSGEDLTPLHNAVKNKQEEIAKLLISYKADINAQDKTGKTPIFYAIQNVDVNITKLLLTNKAIIKDNPELLSIAVQKECLEIIEILLQHDIDIDASDKDGRTALHFTTLREDEYCTNEFADYSPKLALIMLSKRNCSVTNESLDIKGKIAKLLLSKGADVNSETKSGITTLCAAIHKGYAKVVETLLEYNANLNSGIKTDVMPLHLAVEQEKEEFITMLLNKGADVNAKCKAGTPLYIATEKGNNKIVNLLLEYGANVHWKIGGDAGNAKPLHLAAEKGDRKIIETLLKFGADINSRDDIGRTALHIASENGDIKTVKILLKYGPDINILTVDNCTPLDYAKHGNDFIYIRRPIFATLKRQIIKMKTADLYVNKKNLLSVKNSNTVKKYQIKCKKELANMKNIKINNTNISYYEILRKDTSSLAPYTKNENVVQVLTSNDYKKEFPIYASMLKSNFRKAGERKKLLDENKAIFYFFFNNFPKLPEECSGKILSFLSDEDLRIIIDACKPS